MVASRSPTRWLPAGSRSGSPIENSTPRRLTRWVAARRRVDRPAVARDGVRSPRHPSQRGTGRLVEWTKHAEGMGACSVGRKIDDLEEEVARSPPDRRSLKEEVASSPGHLTATRVPRATARSARQGCRRSDRRAGAGRRHAVDRAGALGLRERGHHRDPRGGEGGRLHQRAHQRRRHARAGEQARCRRRKAGRDGRGSASIIRARRASSAGRAISMGEHNAGIIGMLEMQSVNHDHDHAREGGGRPRSEVRPGGLRLRFSAAIGSGGGHGRAARLWDLRRPTRTVP